MSPRVLCAMSGGVDSSVAAALLLEAGHEVVGATLKLWGGESDSGCCSVADVDDARRVAAHLGIDHHVFAFGEEFSVHVVETYVAGHSGGLTPNPCIECNRHIKFAKLLRRADALGFDAVATGHHARVVERSDGSWRVARGDDRAKDQSYVLYMLGQSQLARTLLPVGELTKAEVRKRAGDLGLATASKAESQDVCFIHSTRGRSGFLAERLRFTPGRVVDAGSGAVVGRVDAVELVTIGQRRGLGVAGGTARRFVIDVDVSAATIVVGPPQDLHTGEVRVRDLVWAGDDAADDAAAGPVLAQCSAHGSPRPGRFHADTGVLVWDEPQRRVAPGQSVVIYDGYDGDEVLGGGIAT